MINRFDVKVIFFLKLIRLCGSMEDLTLRPEIIVVAPTPMHKFRSGAAIPVDAFLYSEEVDRQTDFKFPENWALALTIDDGDTTIVPSATLRGEIPGLSDGRHTIAIALVDTLTHGDLLGPRSRVHFAIGAGAQPTLSIVLPRSGILWRDSPAESVTVTLHIDNHPLLPPDCCDVTVNLDGVRIGEFREWAAPPPAGEDPSPAAAAGQPSAEAAGIWSARVGPVADGLHSVEAVMIDAAGMPSSFSSSTTFAAAVAGCCRRRRR
jgi:hypothetical protein